MEVLANGLARSGTAMEATIGSIVTEERAAAKGLLFGGWEENWVLEDAGWRTIDGWEGAFEWKGLFLMAGASTKLERAAG